MHLPVTFARLPKPIPWLKSGREGAPYFRFVTRFRVNIVTRHQLLLWTVTNRRTENISNLEHAWPEAFGHFHPAETCRPVEKLSASHVSFRYGKSIALKDISVPLYAYRVTAFMGPSGCGKSTLLRIFNRMYDLYPDQYVEGNVLLDGEDILGRDVDVNILRSRIGMIYQKPTPFPMSIYDNVAFGIRLYENSAAARWTSMWRPHSERRHCGTKSRIF